jgi:hypothetical protein
VLSGGGAVLKSRLPAVAEQRNFAANGGLAFSVIWRNNPKLWIISLELNCSRTRW